jgi:hypothetical protein
VRRSRLAAIAVLSLLGLTSCDSSPTVVQGSEVSSYIAAVLVQDTRGLLQTGTAPAAASGPSVTTPATVSGITGGSARLSITGSSQFRWVAVSVPGVNGYYLVELPFDVTSTNAIITVAGNVPRRDFDVVFAVADGNGAWGGGDATAVSVISVAGGDIQVSVTWNTEADVDLHVLEPGGEEIYYGNRSSNTGGELDIDANAACGTSNLRQENVGWSTGEAPPGQYIVRVEYWSSCGAVQTDYIVTVYLRSDTPTVPGSPGSGVLIFEGSFTGDGTAGGAGDGVPITTFTF